METRRAEFILAVEAAGISMIDDSAVLSEADARSLILDAGLWIGQRQGLEEDPRFRQLIPYIVVSDGNSLLGYRRGAAGSEARLHGRWSVGFGGHIDLCDVRYSRSVIDLHRTIQVSARRELTEEVGLNSAEVLSQSFLGLIAISDSPVERVHLGWVEVWRVPRFDHLGSTELPVESVHPINPGEASPDEFERWSSLAIEMVRRSESN
ncbi:MAG: hypothetical protein AAGA37_06625 [Actinomycetota bacterium]